MHSTFPERVLSSVQVLRLGAARALLLAAAVAGCGGGSDGPVTVIPVPVASVTLSTSAETIALGETVQLTATARDVTGRPLAGRPVTWETRNPNYAIISTEGLVSPVAPGAVTITATVEGQTAQAAITVIVARPVNRFAYAFAGNPSSSSPYTPDPAVSFNATGGKIEITRIAAGEYDIVFGRLAKSPFDREIVLVSAQGMTQRCLPFSWNNTATSDLHVRVFCTGDSRFSVLVVGAGTLPGRSGFAWANLPAAPLYLPPDSYSYSSSSQRPSLSRMDVGNYTADLKLPHGAGDLPEHYVVVPYGDQTKTCRVADWSATVSVRCTTLTGVAADALYDVALFEQGRPNKRFGFAVADQPAAAMYTPNPSIARNSSGGAITVKRTGTGLYEVTFAGLARPTGGSDHVQLTNRVTTGPYTYCNYTDWFSTGADLVVRVSCFDSTGSSPADAQFQVLVIE